MFKLVRDPWFLILNYKISFHSTTKFNDPRFLNERFQKVFKYLMDVFQAKVTENTVPKQWRYIFLVFYKIFARTFLFPEVLCALFQISIEVDVHKKQFIKELIISQ